MSFWLVVSALGIVGAWIGFLYWSRRWLRRSLLPPRLRLQPAFGVGWASGIELALVVLGGLLIAHVYLDAHPDRIPAGRELLSEMHYYHFWRWLFQCGLCAFWAPFAGGKPLIAEPMAALWYPPVALPVIFLGVRNGLKFALVLAFILAGLAQWWQLRLWRLRPWIRVWAAWMLMTSGMLAGRLELGALGVTFSLAAATWLFPAWWYLWHRSGPRAHLPFAIALGLFLLAGRGYIQMAFFLVWPGIAALTYILLAPPERKGFLRRTARALGTAFILAAPVLLPFLRVWSAWAKEVDPTFQTAQPLQVLLLDFVVSKPDFYRSDILGQLPYPHLTFHFIGWIPLLLATLAVGFYLARPQDETRPVKAATMLVWTLWLTAILALATAEPLRFLIRMIDIPKVADFLGGMRHVQQVAALSIPLWISLAALAAHLLQDKLAAIRLILRIKNRSLSLPAALVLGLALWFALRQGWHASRAWMYLVNAPDLDAELAFLAQAGYQWVETPFGEHQWIEPAVARDLKILVSVRRWKWKEWEMPRPRRVLERHRREPGTYIFEVVLDEALFGYELPDAEYALVQTSDGTEVPCRAIGLGGVVDVHCETPQPGRLWVYEKSWLGWIASVDGGTWRVLPTGEDYLTLDLPAGAHRVRLRYIPWDTLLGFLSWTLFLPFLIFGPEAAKGADPER